MLFFKLWLAYGSFGVSVLIFLWLFKSVKTFRKYQELKKEVQENKEQSNLEPPKQNSFDIWDAIKFSFVLSFFPALCHYMIAIL